MANLPAKDATGATVYIKADGTGTDDSNAYRVTNRLENTSGTQINPATEDTLAEIAAAIDGTEVQVDIVSAPTLTVTGPLTDTQLRASAVPISATGLPLPSGAATEATLAATEAKIPPGLAVVGGRLIVDPSEVTQPISASTLPLPSGASTAANQDTANSHLSTLAGTVGSGAIAVSGPLTDDQLRANPVPVTGSIEVSNTVVLAVFRALDDGTGYSTGDIIVLRQTPPDEPEYYNATQDEVISTPSSADLGPLATASNVIVDSGTVTANLGTIAGVATETTLGAINGKLPSNLTVASTRLLVDGSGVTQPVSFSSLPTGSNVIGAVTQSGSWTVATELDQPLTNTQLRDSAVSVSASSLPLPSGAATEAKQDSLIALLPTALGAQSAAGSLSIVPGTGTSFTVNNSGTFAVQASQSGTWNVDTGLSQGLTDAQLRATAVPVSGTVNLGTIAGVATETTLETINGKLPSSLTVTSNRLLVDGSGTTQPVSLASLPALATGSNVIGAVTQSGSWTVSTGLDQPLTDAQLRATAVPTSLASLPTLSVPALGATDDAAATSDTGTFSLISLFKRLLSRLSAPRLYVASSIITSGDNTIISAPGAGVRIVVTGIRIQNSTSTATTVLIKDGAATTLARLRTPTDGSGLSENYSLGDEIRLSEATAFVVNLSGANAHGVSVRYWLETVSTGLPA